jgi:hypothetical protein
VSKRLNAEFEREPDTESGPAASDSRWKPDDLDRLERAIAEGSRIYLMRRGTDYSVRPKSLRSEGATEVLIATHTTTGEDLEFRLDEVDTWNVQ